MGRRWAGIATILSASPRCWQDRCDSGPDLTRYSFTHAQLPIAHLPTESTWKMSALLTLPSALGRKTPARWFPRFQGHGPTWQFGLAPLTPTAPMGANGMAKITRNIMVVATLFNLTHYKNRQLRRSPNSIQHHKTRLFSCVHAAF